MRVLLLTTRWLGNAFRFDLNEDGLVQYKGEFITPQDCYERFKNQPMQYDPEPQLNNGGAVFLNRMYYDILRAAVIERFDTGNSDKPFRWEEIERFK